ncbi:MAG: hypothetical protein OEV28_06120, partial [Nitrospirota bacterium]|nr:hypothetical protein [Nitrospirota bacterium]
KACWNCLFGVGEGDPSMGFESLTWDCEHPKLKISVAYERFADLVGDTADWDPRRMPAKCGVYEPHYIAFCAICQKDINHPEWSWTHWAEIPFPVPVCSDECRDNALAHYDPVTKQYNGPSIDQGHDHDHDHDHNCGGHH